MAINLLINGQLADIDPDQTFAITYQSADLSDLGSRTAPYSTTWALPMSLNNCKLFGQIQDANGNTTFGNTQQRCLVYKDNTLLLDGYIVVTDTDTNIFNCCVVGALKGLFDKLNITYADPLNFGIITTRPLTLRDLNIGLSTITVSDTDIRPNTWTAANVALLLKGGSPDCSTQYPLFDDGTQQGLADQTTGLPYILRDSGGVGDPIVYSNYFPAGWNWNPPPHCTNIDGYNSVPLLMFRPWFSLLILLQGIIENQGYTVNGDLSFLKSAVISGGLAHPDLNFVTYAGGITNNVLNGKWNMPSTSWLVGALLCSAAPQRAPLTVPSGQVTTYYDGTSGENAFYYSSNSDINSGNYGWVKIEIQYSFKFEPYTGISAGDAITVSIVSRNAATNIPVILAQNVNQVAQQLQLITLSAVVYVTQNCRIQVMVQSADYTLSTPDWTSLNWSVVGGEYFQITPIDMLAPGCLITERCLPLINQGDFIKDVLIRYGLLMQVNESAQTVTFSKLNNLQLQNNALDWSDKVASEENSIIPNMYRSSFWYDTLAKINWYYNASPELGGWAIRSNTPGTEITKTVYTSPIDIGLVSTIYNGILGWFKYLFTVNSGQPVMNWYSMNLTFADESSGGLPVGLGVISKGGYLAKSVQNYVVAQQGATPPDSGLYYGDAGLPQCIYGGSNGWQFCAPSDFYSVNETPIIGDIVPCNLAGTYWDNNSGKYIAIKDINGESHTGTASVTQITFSKQNWYFLLSTYNAPLQAALLNPRIDSRLVRVNEADLQNIDFSRPVVIYGIKYYINAIVQFDPINLRPTQIDLLQLGNQ